MDPDGGPSLYIQILLLIILNLVNAFFAAAEIAIIAVDPNKVEDQAEGGDSKAKIILQFRKDQSKFLSTIQVGITFANLFSSAFAATGISVRLSGFFARLGMAYSSTISLILVTFILSYITLVFGELVPKRLALQNPAKVANFVIKPVAFFSKITKPFVSFLSFSTNTVLRILGVDLEGVEEKVTLEDLKSLVNVGQEQGVINKVEKTMIDSVIVFDDKQAEEIMTARTEVFMIDIEDPFEDYLDKILELKFSRIPVYEGSVDNIIGILYVKDLLKFTCQCRDLRSIDLRKVVRPAYFVPERKNINELFLELKASKNHIAILIDEYGGFSGIITMEDLIEEIVGEIDDEYDHDEPEFKKLDDNIFLVKGSMSIIDINNQIYTDLNEEEEDYDTVAGLVIHELGYIPDPGEKISVEREGIKFTVLDADDNRIRQVKMEIPDEMFIYNQDHDEDEEN